MRSSAGEHFIALDHLRALAAFLVFVWHFTHGYTGSPVPFEYIPSFFLLAPFDEGHVGVSLFMALSGYLFAKLLHGKQMYFMGFLQNRLLRLCPLLVVVIALAAVKTYWQGGDMIAYAAAIAQGPVFPTLPNGGWSITVELHFYVLLPLLLWLVRKNTAWMAAVLAASITGRWLLWKWQGEIQSIAFWTIIGRIDQFVLGILAFHLRDIATKSHWSAAAVLLTFSLFYWYFDSIGGFHLAPTYPSPSPLWIIMPTVEGAAFAFLIAYYDSSFTPPRSGASRFVGLVGTYSYSIYLLHFFVVFAAARLVHSRIADISNFHVALVWAFAVFLCMMPLGYLSFRYIEAPFLNLRVRYTRPRSESLTGPDATGSITSSN